MTKYLKPKIVVKVEGEGEIPRHERELYFSYSSEVLVNNRFEVEEVREIAKYIYGRDCEEIEPQPEEMSTIIELVKEQASRKALESISISDFEDEKEEY